jgi:predicted NBD/HSP70 family sugar kinase
MSNVKRKPQAVAAIEQALLRCVRMKGLVSRGELAQELDLVQSTIGVYVDRLVRDGYLKETIPAERGLGRPPLLVELNARRGRFIGVDFYSQRLKAVAVDFSQQVLGQVEYDLPQPVTAAAVMEILLRAIGELIDDRPDDVLAIGIATPGFVDSEQGIGREYAFIADWKDIPLAETIRQRHPFPVYMENNIRAHALAEYWFGQGRGLKHFVCLSIRAGIATGIVIDGQLFTGSTNIAGEVGHWRIPRGVFDANRNGSTEPDFPTVEDVSSLTALARIARERIAAGQPSKLSGHSAPTVPDLLAAAQDNDALAGPLIDQAADAHAWMVQQLDCLLDPERILIAGPLTDSAAYWERLQDTCRKFGVQRLSSKVCRSELGRFGGAMGAAALAVQYWKPVR